MKKFYKILVVLPFVFAAVLLTSCRTQTIYNVNKASVAAVIPGKRAVSTSKVQRAITKAAVGLGWEVKNVRPGLIDATLNLRGHTAVVAIPYNSQSYSILYKSSYNLRHQGNQIHRNYNSWVRNLNNAIKANLAHGV